MAQWSIPSAQTTEWVLDPATGTPVEKKKGAGPGGTPIYMPGGPLVQTIDPWAISYGAGAGASMPQRTYYKDRYGRCTVGPALNPADDFGPCDLRSQMGPALSPQAQQLMTQQQASYPQPVYPTGGGQPININVGTGGGAYPVAVPYPTQPSGPSWADLFSIFGQQPAPQPTPVLYADSPTYQTVGGGGGPGAFAPESFFAEQQPQVQVSTEEQPKTNWLIWAILGGAAVYALTKKRKRKQ